MALDIDVHPATHQIPLKMYSTVASVYPSQLNILTYKRCAFFSKTPF